MRAGGRQAATMPSCSTCSAMTSMARPIGSAPAEARGGKNDPRPHTQENGGGEQEMGGRGRARGLARAPRGPPPGPPFSPPPGGRAAPPPPPPPPPRSVPRFRCPPVVVFLPDRAGPGYGFRVQATTTV